MIVRWHVKGATFLAKKQGIVYNYMVRGLLRLSALATSLRGIEKGRHIWQQKLV